MKVSRINISVADWVQVCAHGSPPPGAGSAPGESFDHPLQWRWQFPSWDVLLAQLRGQSRRAGGVRRAVRARAGRQLAFAGLTGRQRSTPAAVSCVRGAGRTSAPQHLAPHLKPAGRMASFLLCPWVAPKSACVVPYSCRQDGGKVSVRKRGHSGVFVCPRPPVVGLPRRACWHARGGHCKQRDAPAGYPRPPGTGPGRTARPGATQKRAVPAKSSRTGARPLGRLPGQDRGA